MAFHLDLEFAKDSAVWKEMLQSDTHIDPMGEEVQPDTVITQLNDALCTAPLCCAVAALCRAVLCRRHENLIEKKSIGALACTYGALPAPVLSHFLTHGHTHKALLPPQSAALLARAEAEGFRFGGRPGRRTAGTRNLDRAELYALTHSAFAPGQEEGGSGAAAAAAVAAVPAAADGGSLGTQHHHAFLASSSSSSSSTHARPRPPTHAALGYLYPPSHPRHGGALGSPYPRAARTYARGPYYDSHVASAEAAAATGLPPEPHPAYLRHPQTSTFRRNTTGRRHDPFPARARVSAAPREDVNGWDEHRALVQPAFAQQQQLQLQQQQQQQQLELQNNGSGSHSSTPAAAAPTRQNTLPSLPATARAQAPQAQAQAVAAWAPVAQHAPPHTARAHAATPRVPSAKAAQYNGGAHSARAHVSVPHAHAVPSAAPRPGVGVAAVAKLSVPHGHPSRAGFAEHAFLHQQQLQQQQQQQQQGASPHSQQGDGGGAHSHAEPLVHSLATSYAAHALSKYNHRPSFGSPGSFRAVPETRDAYDRGLHASQRLW